MSEQEARNPSSDLFSVAIIEALRALDIARVDLDALICHLSKPLHLLGISPLNKSASNPTLRFQNIHHCLPQIQHFILTRVAPIWNLVLQREHKSSLLTQYFCPKEPESSLYGAFIAVHAFCAILSEPLTRYSLGLLGLLVSHFDVSTCYYGIFKRENELPVNKKVMLWEDYVNALISLPMKVANFIENREYEIPELQTRNYSTTFCKGVYNLVVKLEDEIVTESSLNMEELFYLIRKMVMHGLFPQSDVPSQVSFFRVNRHSLLSQTSERNSRSMLWGLILKNMTQSSQQSIIISLLSALELPPHPLDNSLFSLRVISREARILFFILDKALDDKRLWRTISAALARKEWHVALGRIVVYGTSMLDMPDFSDPPAPRKVYKSSGIEMLMNEVTDIWTSPLHIQHSLLSKHQGLSTLFLLILSSLDNKGLYAETLSSSPSFISCIGTYLSHLDKAIRLCGLLVAEVVAEFSGRDLHFGGWEGNDQGKAWARSVRSLLTSGTEYHELGNKSEVFQSSSSSQKEGAACHTTQDSDDSLNGYASDVTASSSSIASEDLAEAERDPSMRTPAKRRPIHPVYISQLLDLLRPNPKSEAADEAERIGIALYISEELIRRKRSFGTELEENAAELARALLLLHDNYDTHNFEENRQSALNALVACAPTVTSRIIIEEYFMQQYSIGQRYVMLNALAFGARELAQLATPEFVFPSRRLGKESHQLLNVDNVDQQGLISKKLLGVSEGIITSILEPEKEVAIDKLPPVIRQRRLRIQSSLQHDSINGPTTSNRGSISSPSKLYSFKDIAAEYFIAPLINRFWLYLRDEQMRETRTRYSSHPYHGAGMATIQHEAILGHFLRTIAVMIHAAHNSPLFLAVLAPESLELGLTLGTKPISTAESGKGKEAEVLVAALELCLYTLSACLELDGGKSLCLEHTTLVLAIGEWSARVLNGLKQGVHVVGGGSKSEISLGRIATGVAWKISEATSKWLRSMNHAISI